jgi:BASS family bile acid:Na+ symporter
MAHSSYTIIDILLSSILALIMFGVGLSLTSGSFKNIFISPKPLLIGLTSQILVLPVIAFIISFFSNMSLPFKVGLIILASCPGGTTSGILTYFFKGNVALSITFTAINSVITLFTIPFIVNLSLLFFLGKSTIVHLSYLETIIQIFSVTIIPAGLGVLIRTYRPGFAAKAQRPIKYLLTVALAIIFVIYFFAGRDSGGTGITFREIINILPYALLLNILCMAWGYYLGRLTRLGSINSYTIGIEASVHNTTLAFLVAGTLLNDPDMVKPSLIYAMFSFWTAVGYSFVVKKINGLGFFSDFRPDK